MTLLVLTLALMRASGAPPSACDSAEALSSVALFVECARAGTEQYHDRHVAIREGYRRIGRDFPAMGEHWIRINRVFDGEFHPSRPEVLTYVEIGGTPRLLGVAYAIPLLAGETLPAGPAGPHAWHDHFRTVDEETLLPNGHVSGRGNEGARLAMMHVWIWSPNPEGMFAADNWAIPYLRCNLIPPTQFSIPAAKALSLISGGRDYVQSSIRAVALGAEQGGVGAALDRAVQEVATTVPMEEQTAINAETVTRLASIWVELWKAIDDAVPNHVRQKLTSLAVR